MRRGWRGAAAVLLALGLGSLQPAAARATTVPEETPEQADDDVFRTGWEGEAVLVPVDLAVSPRWSINHGIDGATWNLLGLGLAGTATERLTGLQLAPGVVIADRADGLQLAGLAAVASARLQGLQVAGLAAVAADEAVALQVGGLAAALGGGGGGVQLGGLGTVAGRDYVGLQVGGLGVVTGRDLLGLQLGGLGGVVGDEGAGLQAAGLAAVVGGGLYGLQVAGLAAVGGERVRGLQVAGLGVVAGARLEGLQVAGLITVTPSLAGAQVAAGAAFAEGGAGLQLAGLHARTHAPFRGAQVALVNVARSLNGVQVGLVNVAEEATGVQLGLVNVARRLRGAPVGAVNWIGPGRWAVEAWGDPATPLNLGFRSGSERVYGLVGLGLAPFDEPDRLSAALGLGLHLPLGGAAFVEPDLVARQLFYGWDPDRRARHYALRLKAGLGLARHLALFVGASANLAVSDSEDLEALAYGPGASRTTDGGTALRLWPGLFAGLRVQP